MDKEQYIDTENWIQHLWQAFASGNWLDDPSDVKFQFFFWGFLILLSGMSIMLKRLHNARVEMNNMRAHEVELEQKNAQFLADKLKFQLQPHTLRNMLLTLREESKKLYQGTDDMAKCLEYVLYSSEDQVVSIEKEIEFITAYVSFKKNMEMLHGKVDLDIEQVDQESEYYTKPLIPHQVIVYLVENAFKHGDKSRNDFLRINVVLDQNVFRIEVINAINKQVIHSDPGGVGLANMQRRLELLSSGRFVYDTSIKEDTYKAILQINL